jgi:hypothetical protein
MRKSEEQKRRLRNGIEKTKRRNGIEKMKRGIGESVRRGNGGKERS